MFGNTTLGADTLSTVEVSMASVIGEDAMNYEFNSHLLVTEFTCAWKTAARRRSS